MLELLRFTGDRNTRPCMVNWFITQVLQYVELGGQYAWGLTEESKKVNTLLSFLSQDPRGGKDCAYRWAASWIASTAQIDINNNDHTRIQGVTTYAISPGCSEFPFSWAEFLEAFLDEYDSSRKEQLRERKLKEHIKGKLNNEVKLRLIDSEKKRLHLKF